MFTAPHIFRIFITAHECAGHTPQVLAHGTVMYQFQVLITTTGPNQGELRWLSGKESTCKCGDTGDLDLIPGSGRSPGAGNGNPLQCSFLENTMGSEPWQATVHGVTKSWTHLSAHNTHTHTHGLCLQKEAFTLLPLYPPSRHFNIY